MLGYRHAIADRSKPSAVCLPWSVALLTFLYSVDTYILNEEAAHQYVDATQIGVHFVGNRKQHEFFKLLARHGKYLIIGSSNTLYNISAEDFSLIKTLEWTPTKADVDDCLMKGKKEVDCQNYIRLYTKSVGGTALVCGTNAFKPLCRLYHFENGEDRVVKEYFAAGILPYDSHQNSSFFYSAETHELFSATTADFGGSDPLIYKTDLMKTDTMGLRTDRYNKNLLNEPNFVTTFADDDFVYFWFREVSYEKQGSGKTMYARVARVCRNDRGTKRRDNWTSFVKARLNCSSPGEFPHYFDELVSTSEEVPTDSSLLRSRLIYGVFNSPKRTFALSDFKVLPSQTVGRMHARLFTSLGARPRMCVNDSRSLNDDVVSLMTSSSLVKDAVPSASKSPLLVMLGYSGKFTHIAIDPHVTAADGREYDVMFIGTDNGRVLKVVNAPMHNEETKPILVEVVTVFAENSSVTGLYVQHFGSTDGKIPNQSTSAAKLIVMSNDQIRSLPLFHCLNAADCWGCLNLQDPYCAWHVHKKKCIGRVSWKLQEHDKAWDDKTILFTKKDCPISRTRDTSTASTYKLSKKDFVKSSSTEDGMNSLNSGSNSSSKNCLCSQGERLFQNVRYEAEAVKQYNRPEYFAIAIPLTFVISSALGFIIGYGCRSGKQPKKNKPSGNKSQTKPNQPNVLTLKPFNRLGENMAILNTGRYIAPGVAVGMYDTVPKVSQNMLKHSELIAGAMRPLTGCNTLPKPQLVKKIYV
uniref:Sema domain-containing protein n=1 Tax=Trichuris muris TaxID=70415 RepID=A0A5S6QA35_TRIMR